MYLKKDVRSLKYCSTRFDNSDIDDMVYMVNYAFNGGPRLPCYDEGDITADGEVDVDDLVWLVNYNFKGGPPPLPCP